MTERAGVTTWSRGSGPSALTIAIAAVLATAATVETRAATDRAGESREVLEEVVVTGSRVERNGFEAPTPLTTLGEDALARVSAPNIAEVINQVPSVRSSLRPTSSVNLSSLAAGNYIDLRGLGYQRTQVLVDGRRYVPTVPAGGVSITAIPQAAIRGIDIVTGGASAAYGSDAVAGVVNLRIDDRLEGFRGDAQGGRSAYDDYQNFYVSLAAGTGFADGRVRLVGAVEVAQNDGIDRVADRPWSARNPGTIANPAGTPRLLLVDGDIRLANVAYGGVINSFRRGTATTNFTTGPIVGLQFRPDGSVAPFNYGTLRTPSQMSGGDGTNAVADGVGAVPVDRYTGFGRVTFDVTDSLSFWAEANYAKVESEFDGLASTFQHTILRDNVFLPTQIRGILDAPGNTDITSFVMGRAIRDTGRIRNRLDIETVQALGGVRGSLAADWTYEAYYSYGRTDNGIRTANNRVSSRFNAALDAVDDPGQPGVNPVCRINVDANPSNNDPACVPINLFGENRFSPAAEGYVNGVGNRLWEIEQQVVAATLRGPLFSTWAGPVSAAFGVEYREQSVATTADPISAVLGFVSGGTVPYAGEVDVKEGFVEALVPLARDRAWAESLSVDVAGRVTDYSTSGRVETWKAGVNWSITPSVRLRATRSRDIRAPSLEELFAAGSTSQLSVDDTTFVPGTTRPQGNYLVTAANAGNPLLTPEIADTLTAGIVLTPQALPQLSVAIDYYDIVLNDAIISLTPATIVRRCLDGSTPELCQFIVRDPNLQAGPNRIVRVNNFPANLQSVETRGIDFEAQYSLPVGDTRSLRLQALVTRVISSSINDGVTRLRLDDSVDQPTIAALGGNPWWRVNVNASLVGERGRMSVTGRYVGGGRISRAFVEGVDIDDNEVNGRFYTDLSGEWFFRNDGDRNRISVYGAVSNLFDVTPPITGIGGFGTTRSLYDTIGRTYTLGSRFSF